MTKPKKFYFKISIFGEKGVGKSTITYRLMLGKFIKEIGFRIGSYQDLKVLIDDYEVGMRIMESPTSEKYHSFLKTVFGASVGGILVYDITNSDSFVKIKWWLEKFKELAGDKEGKYLKWIGEMDKNYGLPVILLGNKLDLSEKRVISEEEAIKFSEDYNIFKSFECSAKTGQNIKETFELLASELVKAYLTVAKIS